MINRLKFLMTLCFIWVSVTGFASESVIEIITKNPQQGSMITGRLLVKGEVYYEDIKLPLTESGEFVFGVGRDAQHQVQLVIKANQQTIKYPLYIAKRQWKTEKIDGLPENKVSPRTKETLERIKREGRKVTNARRVKSPQKAFLSKFEWPAKGRISGVYGSQRILNGIPKRPHFGLDIANKAGTEIFAPADGVVTLSEEDLFYSGGTIIIDHGFGINTTYLHLSSLAVKIGDDVKQGEVIGRMGQTGRATGSHLDWRLNWRQSRLDPQLLLDKAD